MGSPVESRKMATRQVKFLAQKLIGSKGRSVTAGLTIHQQRWNFGTCGKRLFSRSGFDFVCWYVGSTPANITLSRFPTHSPCVEKYLPAEFIAKSLSLVDETLPQLHWAYPRRGGFFSLFLKGISS